MCICLVYWAIFCSAFCCVRPPRTPLLYLGSCSFSPFRCVQSVRDFFSHAERMSKFSGAPALSCCSVSRSITPGVVKKARVDHRRVLSRKNIKGLFHVRRLACLSLLLFEHARVTSPISVGRRTAGGESEGVEGRKHRRPATAVGCSATTASSTTTTTTTTAVVQSVSSQRRLALSHPAELL